MSGNELPKVIDKTPADIDAAIEAIKSSNLSNATQDFAISCIKLAAWLPKALVEHKIKLSNLRKLIFGFSEQNTPSETDVSNSLSCLSTKKGHGCLSHSAYSNAIEHQLSISNFKVAAHIVDFSNISGYSKSLRTAETIAKK